VHDILMWLYDNAQRSICELPLLFPVRGHSYLPLDRLFRRIVTVNEANSTLPPGAYKVL